MNSSTQPHVTAIKILFEDNYCIAINKPNNYLVHQSQYAGQLHEQSIVEFLIDQTQTMYYPIHRLDRKTSGVLLLAKEKSFVHPFQQLFQGKNELQKIYYAIVRGFAPDSGIIDTPIKNEDTGIYKDALTHYATLCKIELPIAVTPYNTSRYSLVKLMPKTGRMHQLRKHLNKISHPIIGDYKYGDRYHNRNFEQNLGCNYMFLHAYMLEFIHPFTLKKMNLKAEIPFDWQLITKKFGWEITDFK